MFFSSTSGPYIFARTQFVTLNLLSNVLFPFLLWLTLVVTEKKFLEGLNNSKPYKNLWNLESENLNYSESSFGGQMLPFIKLLNSLVLYSFLCFMMKNASGGFTLDLFFKINFLTSLKKMRYFISRILLLIEVLYIEYLLKDTLLLI